MPFSGGVALKPPVLLPFLVKKGAAAGFSTRRAAAKPALEPSVNQGDAVNPPCIDR